MQVHLHIKELTSKWAKQPMVSTIKLAERVYSVDDYCNMLSGDFEHRASTPFTRD
jgi:hypothetical protein